MCVRACAPTTKVHQKSNLCCLQSTEIQMRVLLRIVILINIFQLFPEESFRPLAVNPCPSSWGKSILLQSALSIIGLFGINLHAHLQAPDRLVISLPSQSHAQRNCTFVLITSKIFVVFSKCKIATGK